MKYREYLQKSLTMENIIDYKYFAFKGRDINEKDSISYPSYNLLYLSW